MQPSQKPSRGIPVKHLSIREVAMPLNFVNSEWRLLSPEDQLVKYSQMMGFSSKKGKDERIPSISKNNVWIRFTNGF